MQTRTVLGAALLASLSSIVNGQAQLSQGMTPEEVSVSDAFQSYESFLATAAFVSTINDILTTALPPQASNVDPAEWLLLHSAEYNTDPWYTSVLSVILSVENVEESYVEEYSSLQAGSGGGNQTSTMPASASVSSATMTGAGGAGGVTPASTTMMTSATFAAATTSSMMSSGSASATPTQSISTAAAAAGAMAAHGGLAAAAAAVLGAIMVL